MVRGKTRAGAAAQSTRRTDAPAMPKETQRAAGTGSAASAGGGGGGRRPRRSAAKRASGEGRDGGDPRTQRKPAGPVRYDRCLLLRAWELAGGALRRAPWPAMLEEIARAASASGVATPTCPGTPSMRAEAPCFEPTGPPEPLEPAAFFEPYLTLPEFYQLPPANLAPMLPAWSVGPIFQAPPASPVLVAGLEPKVYEAIEVEDPGSTAASSVCTSQVPSPIQGPVDLSKAVLLEQKVRKQIEYYFSNDNLMQDVYFRSLMDDEGFVGLNEVVTFPRVMRSGFDAINVAGSLVGSRIVEISWDHPPRARLRDVKQRLFFLDLANGMSIEEATDKKQKREMAAVAVATAEAVAVAGDGVATVTKPVSATGLPTEAESETAAACSAEPEPEGTAAAVEGETGGVVGGTSRDGGSASATTADDGGAVAFIQPVDPAAVVSGSAPASFVGVANVETSVVEQEPTPTQSPMPEGAVPTGKRTRGRAARRKRASQRKDAAGEGEGHASRGGEDIGAIVAVSTSSSSGVPAASHASSVPSAKVASTAMPAARTAGSSRGKGASRAIRRQRASQAKAAIRQAQVQAASMDTP